MEQPEQSDQPTSVRFQFSHKSSRQRVGYNEKFSWDFYYSVGEENEEILVVYRVEVELFLFSARSGALSFNVSGPHQRKTSLVVAFHQHTVEDNDGVIVITTREGEEKKINPYMIFQQLLQELEE